MKNFRVIRPNPIRDRLRFGAAIVTVAAMGLASYGIAQLFAYLSRRFDPAPTLQSSDFMPLHLIGIIVLLSMLVATLVVPVAILYGRLDHLTGCLQAGRAVERTKI